MDALSSQIAEFDRMNARLSLIAALFPLRAEDRVADLSCRGFTPDGKLIVDLAIWERFVPGSPPSLRDLKEQDLIIVPEAHRDHPRLPELLLGWALAVEEVLSQTRSIETMLPSDFVPDRSAFALKLPLTAEEYRAVFLTKGRLGKYL